MNKNNLNRIKGILSAKQGTLVPKFLEGAKFVRRRGNRLIYSADGTNWFYDQNLTLNFNGNLEKYDNSIQIGTEDTPAGVNYITQDQIDSINKKNKIAGNVTQFTGQALQSIGDTFGAYLSVTDSQLTKNIDAAYNGISSAVSNMGPIGQVAGMVMNTLGAIGNISQAMGGGTDQQTKLDSWMDSPLLSWNVGAINGFFGKNTDSFGVDLETLLQVGDSYGGTATSINEAAESADKKYGLFSYKSRKKANDAIEKAKLQQNLMGNIANQASDQRLAVQSMGEQAGLAYSMMTNGGYDLKYTYAAKQGGVIEWEPNLSLNWEPKIKFNLELPEFKEGGLLEKIDWTPKLQKGNKIRTLEELIEYAKKENPRFIQRLSEEPRGIEFTDNEGNKQYGSHLIGWELDENGNAIVFPSIQEMENGELKLLSTWNAYDRAIENNNYLKMTPEEAKLFTESGEDEDGNLFGYKIGWIDFFKHIPKNKEGGSLGDKDIPEIEETNLKNVIPEGALHKNKHHMEHAEGLTKKGIPVIDEEGEQQAEIEHSEIIFTLEVTKKLEEYYQIFYSEESTNKEKEQAALDAGKLLVYQILENTEDRTGLIESCKQGGTLNIKESNKNFEKELIKKAFKEVLIELLTK